MAIPKQTANFPFFDLPEQSWSNNLRALSRATLPQGVLKGLALTLPASGATPVLSDGHFVDGDHVAGPFGSKLITAAPRNANRIGLYFGLEGLFYATAAEAASAANPMYQLGETVSRGHLIGEVSTTDVAEPEISLLTQYLHLDTSRMGIRSIFRPGLLGAGSDRVLAELPLPAGYRNARIAFATYKVLTAVTVVTATDDTALVKYKADAEAAATLVTVSNANLGAVAGTTVAAASVIYLPTATETLQLLWNMTDANASVVAGAIEVNAVVDLF
jgi:hypothetical protein